MGKIGRKWGSGGRFCFGVQVDADKTLLLLLRPYLHERLHSRGVLFLFCFCLYDSTCLNYKTRELGFSLFDSLVFLCFSLFFFLFLSLSIFCCCSLSFFVVYRFISLFFFLCFSFVPCFSFVFFVFHCSPFFLCCPFWFFVVHC